MSGSSRPDALARLDAFVGAWTVDAVFPGDGPDSPPGHCEFEWILGGQFLVQRTEIPVPEAPDSWVIIGVASEGDGYTWSYFDSRGVARLYTMSLTDRVWRLERDQADLSPLQFRQRFTGTFSDDGDTIHGAWEISFDESTWEHDFTLAYRRIH
jgi:hypothetical protein